MVHEPGTVARAEFPAGKAKHDAAAGPGPEIRIILVEDNAGHARLISRAFESSNLHCHLEVFSRIAETRARLLEVRPPDLLIADWRLPDGSGLELLAGSRGNSPFPVIILTAHGDEDIAVRAMKAGAMDYVVKTAAALADMPRIAERVLGEWERISARRKAEQALNAAGAFLQSVIDGVSDSLVVIGSDYRVRFANKTAREMHFPVQLGQEEAPFCYTALHSVDRPCSKDKHACPLGRVLETGTPVTATHRYKGPGGSEIVLDIVASPVFDEEGRVTGIVKVGRDVTERLRMAEEQKKLETALFQRERDKSILTLASGMGHELNNVLMSIMGNAELLEMEIGDNRQLSEFAQNIKLASSRMAGLTRELLAYAGGGKNQPRTIALNAAISKSLERAAGGRAAAGVKINFDAEQDLWPVNADPAHMDQMLYNIIANAFEAMEGTGGTLNIRASNTVRQENWECLFSIVHPAGDYVHVEISDTGPGIPAEQRQRVFEPFFTTKFLGRGLGLAAASGIIQHHGGGIDVESTAGGGTTFHVFLPRAVKKRAGRVRDEAASGRPIGGKVLVADDEAGVRELLKRVLGINGYDVVTADGGVQALEKLESEGEQIGLVVLDMLMTDMHGREVYRRIKAEDPDIPVLLTSGYDRETALQGVNLNAGDDFIQKPHRASYFMKKVREMTGAESGAQS